MDNSLDNDSPPCKSIGNAPSISSSVKTVVVLIVVVVEVLVVVVVAFVMELVDGPSCL